MRRDVARAPDPLPLLIVTVSETRPLEAVAEVPGDSEDAQQQALDAEAARLRTLGYSYREIAAAEGVKVSTAYRRVTRALMAEPTDAGRLRALETRRLDDLWKAAWREVIRTDAKPVERLSGVQTCVKIMERRARLYGLDQPVQIEATIAVREQIDTEIERLVTEAAAIDA